MDNSAQYIPSTDRSLSGHFTIYFREVLPKTLVRTPPVVIGCVLQQHRLQMTVVDDEQVVETFLSDGTYPTLGKRIGIRRPNGRADHFDLLRGKHLIESGRKFGVAIMEQIAKGWLSVFEFPAELSGLLRDPCGSWMFGTATKFQR